MNQSWKIKKSRYLIQDRWLTLRADTCETPSGVIVDPYYVQELVDWVNVAAFDDKQRMLVVTQYRHGCGKVTLELPAGCVDPGEPPLDSIRRELLEETGCTVREIWGLPIQNPNPARSNNHLFSFVAVGAEVVAAQNLDPSEGISFSFIPVREVLMMIDEGQFCFPMHVANVFSGIRRLNHLASIGEVSWDRVEL